MTRCISLVLVLLSIVTTAVAESPSRDALTRKLFILWSEDSGVPYSSLPREGVFAYDLDNHRFAPVAPFGFITTSLALVGNQVALGATADRFIVEGTDYYEFDVASGRLLRRYRALREDLALMRLHGFVLSEAQALTVGSPSGIYGFPNCTASGLDQMPCSNAVVIPGSSVPVSTYDAVLRRSLAPEKRDLQVVRALPAPDGERNFQAFVALDSSGNQVWTWRAFVRNSNEIVQRLSSLALNQAGQERVVREMSWGPDTPHSQRLLGEQFLFHPRLQSFFVKLVSHDDDTWRFVRWPEDLSSEEVILSGKGSSYHVGAMTALAEELPATYTQVVPLVRHADNDLARWRSELWLFNPSEESMSVTLRRVASQQSISYALAPHASMTLLDVLKQLGGGAVASGGDGVESDALVLTSSYRWGAQLSAYSRTATISSRAEDRGGSLGYTVPAVPGDVGYSTHTPLFQYGFDTDASQVSLIMDKRDPSQYRHTIGVVNDSDEPFDVRLRYASSSALPYDSSSPLDRSFSAAPHSVTTREIESLYPASFATDRPPRIWLTADHPAPIWMSMTDTRSGDVTFVPYSVFSLRSDPTTQITVPAIGSGFGSPAIPQASGRRRSASAAGSVASPWRTDLYGFFFVVDGNEESQRPLTDFDPATDRCAAASAKLSGVIGWDRPTEGVNPYYKNIFPDVAAQFSCSGGGAIRLRGYSWMAGYARNYLTRPNGGTVGDILPFYPTDGWPVQHFSGIQCNSTSQVTIGLYNGAAYPVTNRLLLYDASGRAIGEREVELPSRASSQVSLGDLTTSCSAPGPYGLSVVPLDKPGEQGRSWAYVSIMDRASGDPTILW